jgi:hypothetical protein
LTFLSAYTLARVLPLIELQGEQVKKMPFLPNICEEGLRGRLPRDRGYY